MNENAIFASGKIRGEFTMQGKKIQVQLTVFSVTEDGMVQIYFPEIGYVDCGSSMGEAEASFHEGMTVLLGDMLEDGLKDLGWSIGDGFMTPPSMEYMVSRDETLREIIASGCTSEKFIMTL